MTLQEFTEAFTHHIELDVTWGEMDALGHVNNVHYIRYFEIARIAYFEEVLKTFDIAHHGTGPILANVTAQYISPVVYPDRLLIGSKVHHLGRTSLRMAHKIFSVAQKKIVCEGDSVLVFFNYREQVKAPLTEEIKELLRRFEKNPGL